ncbi:MAG: hypothetical protein IKL10_02795 [Clostridia bacterium]|nr:hypothetical protein [Clostridia bacterium]
MFGFVVANPQKLTDEQNVRYKAVYCGLCEDLGKERGIKCRIALTYDLVFLAIVLSSVCGEEYMETVGRCPVHPAKKRKFLQNKYTSYAADMNIALAYYKYIDDWQDDNSKSAYMKAKLFSKEVEKIAEKYPEQCEAIKKCLSELTEIEKNGVLVPDVPAVVFGKLLGSVFAVLDTPLKSYLYDFGFALGKFIYVMDAAVDLKSDIKKQKYNPFIQYSFIDTEPVLQMLMAECVEKYKVLPIKQDKEIIENILFSGVWTAFDARKKGK